MRDGRRERWKLCHAAHTFLFEHIKWRQREESEEKTQWHPEKCQRHPHPTPSSLFSTQVHTQNMKWTTKKSYSFVAWLLLLFFFFSSPVAEFSIEHFFSFLFFRLSFCRVCARASRYALLYEMRITWWMLRNTWHFHHFLLLLRLLVPYFVCHFVLLYARWLCVVQMRTLPTTPHLACLFMPFVSAIQGKRIMKEDGNEKV